MGRLVDRLSLSAMGLAAILAYIGAHYRRPSGQQQRTDNGASSSRLLRMHVRTEGREAHLGSGSCGYFGGQLTGWEESVHASLDCGRLDMEECCGNAVSRPAYYKTEWEGTNILRWCCILRHVSARVPAWPVVTVDIPM